MNWPSWAVHPAVWITVTLAGFGLCTYLPPRIQDPVLRRRVNLYLLVPISLVLILYVYPVGIEFCRRLGVGMGR
ncbi:MAG: hypothetical protein A2Y02_00125 [Omnitrophica bacterium GWA2_52_12]|nr:MAG: hypothetical protein A2Y02_00125 [Omnitrophica bacterium GWA2_52_12]